MPRFVVLEGPATATARSVAAGLAARTVPGWEVPAPPGTVRLGTVADAAGAAAAVLAAVAGADLVVLASAERDVIDQLCDDLRRLGELDHRVDAPTAPGLSADERALLARLIAGESLGTAARALHLSRRTADRRLAAAKRVLGANSTSEALVLARKQGVIPAQDGRTG